MIVEGFLQRAQLAVDRNPLDRGDPVAIGLHGEHEAGFYRLAVQMDGAGAADALIGAGDMGAGERGNVANEVDEQQRIGTVCSWTSLLMVTEMVLCTVISLLPWLVRRRLR